MKYKFKDLEIEAHQMDFTATLADIPNWILERVTSYKCAVDGYGDRLVMGSKSYFASAGDGDWIIKCAGHISCLSDELFQLFYEKIADGE